MITNWDAPSPTPGLFPEIGGWAQLVAEPTDNFTQEDIEDCLRAVIDLTEWIYTPFQVYLGLYGFMMDAANVPVMVNEIDEVLPLCLGTLGDSADAQDGQDVVHAQITPAERDEAMAALTPRRTKRPKK